MTQEKLALKASLDRTYIASVENGKRNISIKNLAKISSALECTLVDIVYGYEENKL